MPPRNLCKFLSRTRPADGTAPQPEVSWEEVPRRRKKRKLKTEKKLGWKLRGARVFEGRKRGNSEEGGNEIPPAGLCRYPIWKYCMYLILCRIYSSSNGE